ncbi:MAG: M14 family zinc carboxypeptidase [Wenzhouxiangella sp.]|nr:M14 family zinc carboxypeptidase [Wenzhouxiangella sp.]
MARFLILLLLLLPLSVAAQTPYEPIAKAELDGLNYEFSIYPESAEHDADLPAPDAFLGFPVGQRTATSAQIDAYARRLADASERVELVEYGRSFEGRPLLYLVISSPENLARTEVIQDGMARLADPRGLEPSERERLISELPGVAWLGYSIHGNESSGSDSALAVMYHLAADRSAATEALLADLVVIVDPNMNPDGRERFMNALDQHRGLHPNVDDQSLLHTGYWPYGRGNHYLFDLNRDWIYARLPETRGRIPHVLRWRPLLLVDAHEMGAQDTYMFSPAREPHNPHLPPYRRTMGQVFADGKARAFDRFAYPYYTGEWHEDFYPGYTDAWASLRGALGVLYEQARLAEDGVQRDTHLISYRQSVHHQVLASLADLQTLQRERVSMLEQFVTDRAGVVSPRGPYGNRSFVILPTGNQARMNDLLDLLHVQQFEVHRLTRELPVARASDQLGRQLSGQTLPAGSLVLRNRQPDGRLLAAMFEFDPRMSTSALTTERERVLREGRSTIYDTTGWNISMMFGLEALTVPEHLDSHLERLDPAARPLAPSAPDSRNAIALVASGADDRANALAGRLMQRGLVVRAARTPSELDGIELPLGSIAITLNDNRNRVGWVDEVGKAAADLGLEVQAVGHGRAPGQLADLGGREWRVLQPPRVALLARGSNNMLDFGAVWYLLDHRLGLRHSHLDEDRAAAMDLRRYNVIYLPERSTWGGGEPLSPALIERLGDWVRAGGTLIASGNAARALTDGEEPMVRVRTLQQVISEDLEPYQDGLYREWLAQAQPLPNEIWGHAAQGQEMPWANTPALPSAEERQRRDQWLRQFMPSGALVANRADTRHWLNAGGHAMLTALFSNSPVLMAHPPVEAPLRVGVYHPAEGDADLVGWAPVPAGHELRVRAGGLLWPEARERIASAAWVTREDVGRGQVILFAHAPAFRGAQLGAMRVLENAIILGPGMGASAPIQLP